MKVAFLRIGVPRQFYLKGLNQIFQVLIFPKWPSLPSATQRIAIYFREMHIFLSINFTGENAYYNAHFVNTDCSLYLSPINQRQAGHLSAGLNPPFFSRLFSNQKISNWRYLGRLSHRREKQNKKTFHTFRKISTPNETTHSDNPNKKPPPTVSHPWGPSGNYDYQISRPWAPRPRDTRSKLLRLILMGQSEEGWCYW